MQRDAEKQFWDGVAFAERFFMGQDEVSKAMRKLCATLELELGDQMHEMVRAKYAEIWHATKRGTQDE